MPQVGCTGRRRSSSTDGRSWRSTGLSWPARRSNLARCPSASTTTARSSPTSPLAQSGLRRLWLGQMPEPFADMAGRPDPGPPGRAAVRRTDALHEVTGADTADADAERADTDAGRRTPRRRTRGHRTRGHWTLTPDTRHRTPDAWTLTENADRATKARQASGHLGHHDEPTARWTPNRVPMGAAHAALGNQTARR
jgi:hypothetical protein